MRTALACGCIAAFVLPAHGSPVSWETIVVSGMTAPDGSVYQNFDAGDIGESGTVAFRATFADTGFAWNLLTHRDGATSLVARVGRPAPGTTRTFTSVTGLSVARTGEVGFLATIGPPAFGDSGVWGFDGVATTGLVAKKGSVLPGGFVVSETIYGVKANGGQYEIAPGSAGIWVGPPGSLSTVARVGDFAPGWEDSGRFTSLGGPGALTPGGNIIFSGNARGQGADIGHGGLWAGPLNSPQLIARELAAAPGGGTYRGLGDSSITDSGRIVFTAGLTGGPTDVGLFSGTPTTISRVARTGDLAPGTGAAFESITRPQINNSGDLVFYATIDRPIFANRTSTSLWRTTAAGLVALAVQGEHAPDTPSGVIFSGLDGLMSNDHGQCAFIGVLFGPGVNSSNNKGIWFTDWDDPSLTRLLVRTGDEFEALPGIYKSISSVEVGSTYGEVEGGHTSLINDGRMAIRLGFTDSTSGLYVVRIPAPSTAALLLLGLVGSRRRTRSA